MAADLRPSVVNDLLAGGGDIISAEPARPTTGHLEPERHSYAPRDRTEAKALHELDGVGHSTAGLLATARGGRLVVDRGTGLCAAWAACRSIRSAVYNQTAPAAGAPPDRHARQPQSIQARFP